MVDIWIVEKIKEEKRKDDRPVLRIPLDDEFLDPPMQEEHTTEEETRGVVVINPEGNDDEVG